MNPAEAIRVLQVNALAAHQSSMGTGDQLVQMLQRAVAQMEKAHNRVQTLSTLLFIAGLCLLGVGIYEGLAGGGEAWAAIIGTSGGITALAAVFWTAPLEKVSASITELVRLETAFLGYIRVIGEIDSFFQMQYLDIISDASNGQAKETLANAIRDTTTQMKEMMSHAIGLIDSHVAGQPDAFEQLQKQVADAQKRLNALETRT
jgi:hypothetical protein